MLIRLLRPEDREEWLRMRLQLWPHDGGAGHLREMEEIQSTPDAYPLFVAERPEGGLGGFLEAQARAWVEGCATQPVGYLEGWYVDEDLRAQGIGRKLVEAAEAWARSRGFQEMASDCYVDNEL
ncbi:MAG: GNAT family N-acetyltransferase, partial [Actinomycetota bacterium]